MIGLNPLFSDHCVLAQGREIRVFGQAEGTVKVTLTGRDGLLAEAEAESREGRFEALLPPVGPRTGCRLTVSAAGGRVTVEDVAVGLVLLCGGQSNMELELQNCAEGPALLQRHSDPELRYFNVPKRARSDPEADQAFAGARWLAVAPGTAADMSAAAYFAARRVRQATGVPVGVIDCYWGGTSAACWLDENTLRETAVGQGYLSAHAEACGDKDMDTYLREEAAFQREMDEWNSRVNAAKARLGADAPWADIEAEAGVCPWHPPVGPGSPYRPAGLFETMLRRVLPVSVTAVLWYQGEEDTFRTDHYDVLLRSLIARWRECLRDPALPFVAAQLPMWQPDDSPEDDPRWPRLRLQQAAVCAADAHAVCVCQIDQGERHNIHPVRKQPIGERLGDAFLRLALGQNRPASPEALGKRVDGPVLTVRVSAPLQPAAEAPRYFELRGADGRWQMARAAISGQDIRLTSPSVPHPTAVRYAFVSWGEVNVFGENGLPLAPFQLD